MKEKIQSIVRHLLTGLVPFVVDSGLLEKADAEESVRLVAAALSIILVRLILWGLSKLKLEKFLSAVSEGRFSMMCMGLVCAAAGLGFALPSCSSIPDGARFDVSAPIPGAGGLQGGVACDKHGCTVKVAAGK